MQENINIDELVSKLCDTLQQFWQEFEATGKTFESIEAAILPLEGKVCVNVTEHQPGGKVKRYPMDQSLQMKQVDFYQHVQSHLPMGSHLMKINPWNNCSEETIQRILKETEERLKKEYGQNIGAPVDNS